MDKGLLVVGHWLQAGFGVPDFSIFPPATFGDIEIGIGYRVIPQAEASKHLQTYSLVASRDDEHLSKHF